MEGWCRKTRGPAEDKSELVLSALSDSVGLALAELLQTGHLAVDGNALQLC